MTISRPFKEDRLALPFPRLSHPGDRWCCVVGFVPAGSVSSSSPLQIIQHTKHLRCLMRSLLLLLFLSRQSICSVISLDPGISRTIHPQEFSKVKVENGCGCHRCLMKSVVAQKESEEERGKRFVTVNGREIGRGWGSLGI